MENNNANNTVELNERYLTLREAEYNKGVNVAEVYEDFPQQHRANLVSLRLEDLQYLAVATNERLRDMQDIKKWNRNALIQRILLDVNATDNFFSAAGLCDKRFAAMRCLQIMLQGRMGSDLYDAMVEEKVYTERDLEIYDLTQVPFGKAQGVADLQCLAVQRGINGIISRCEHTLKQWERGEGVMNGF